MSITETVVIKDLIHNDIKILLDTHSTESYYTQIYTTFILFEIAQLNRRLTTCCVDRPNCPEFRIDLYNRV